MKEPIISRFEAAELFFTGTLKTTINGEDVVFEIIEADGYEFQVDCWLVDDTDQCGLSNINRRPYKFDYVGGILQLCALQAYQNLPNNRKTPKQEYGEMY